MDQHTLNSIALHSLVMHKLNKEAFDDTMRQFTEHVVHHHGGELGEATSLLNVCNDEIKRLQELPNSPCNQEIGVALFAMAVNFVLTTLQAAGGEVRDIPNLN
jgi:hypothetical protein